MSVLIKNAEMVTMEDQRVVTGSLLIEGGKIKHIFPEGELPDCCEAAEVIDAEGKLVIPGMTNAHYHSYSNLLKGTESRYPLEVWSLYTVAYGHSLSVEDIHDAVLLGAAEMIRNGITGCIDHFPHFLKSEAALEAYQESKMHVAFAPMLHDIPDHKFLQIDFPDRIEQKLTASQPPTPERMKHFYEGLIRRWHGKDERIHIMIGPNAPQRCSREMLRLSRELSDLYALNVHTHLLETYLQRDYGMRTYKKGIIGHLDHAGLLNERLSTAHAVWLAPEEIDLLADRGVSIIHNPASNMILGSGTAPIMTYTEKDIPVSLGTDASNCGTSHNLFEMMKLALMMQRNNASEYHWWPTAHNMLEMGITQGAALLPGKRGKIKAGYQADLVFLDKNNPVWAAVNDVHEQLVFHENGQSIESVMIKGKWVMRDRKILSFNEDEVIDRVRRRSHHRLEKSTEALRFAEEQKPFFEAIYK
ncbi:5-methylthioadenosine/S-adenosylhomocysteine deaminase [Thalassobacillus devorans]|nr:amidohydrolase family protein [Thalassobacillus devorans]NIK27142.1 5-methylthioadenosine/S-adenosylhomocysteine deaminase [Thalassobacillus devorans]